MSEPRLQYERPVQGIPEDREPREDHDHEENDQDDLSSFFLFLIVHSVTLSPAERKPDRTIRTWEGR